MFEQILLAVDGSEHALKAAKLAGDLARAGKAGQFRILKDEENNKNNKGVTKNKKILK